MKKISLWLSLHLPMVVRTTLLILLFTACSKEDKISSNKFGTVTDIDGNFYKTVKIGNQWWMTENLKVTHYRNNAPIPNIIDDAEWVSITNGAYCWYDNDSISNSKIYGALYNWYTINDTCQLCPEGWRIPTASDWASLVNYLNGNRPVGGKMKVTGTKFWLDPNVDATNESGFSGLPGGYRYLDGSYEYIHIDGTWWASTSAPDVDMVRLLTYNDGYLHDIFWDNTDIFCGFSVRCVKDE